MLQKGEKSRDVGTCTNGLFLYRLVEAVTPLLGKPYSEQLEIKLANMREFLSKVSRLVKKTRPVGMQK